MRSSRTASRGFFGDALDLGQFDHGESLQMRIGTGILHGPQDIQVILIRELGINPAHHVDLGNLQVPVRGQAVLNLTRGKHIATLVLGFYVEGTEPAKLVADIGVVDVLVADVIGGVSVESLTDHVGQISQHRKLVAGVELHPLLHTETSAIQYRAVYIGQPGPVDLFLVKHKIAPNLLALKFNHIIPTCPHLVNQLPRLPALENCRYSQGKRCGLGLDKAGVFQQFYKGPSLWKSINRAGQIRVGQAIT